MKNSIEQYLRDAVVEEQERSGKCDLNVAYRLYDLGKYLAARMRLDEAEPIMTQAVFLVAYNTVIMERARLSEDAVRIIRDYKILLKVLDSNL